MIKMRTNESDKLILNCSSSMHQIEEFVESICDKLFINETYFGNILITVGEVFNLVKSMDKDFTLFCDYHTDFQVLSIAFRGVKESIIELISTNSSLSETHDTLFSGSVFLIQSLSDNIDKTLDNTLQVSFDIGAIHNSIYLERSGLLKSYLNRLTTEKVKLSNDFH